MKARDLLRHVAGVGAITVLDRLGALVMGMLLVRWLGEDGYGVYALVMAAVAVALVRLACVAPTCKLCCFNCYVHTRVWRRHKSQVASHKRHERHAMPTTDASRL